MKRILKVIFFLGIGLGSFLIGDSIIFYAKGYIGQKLLNYAWNESKITENNIKPWPWSETYPVGKLIIPKINFDRIIIEGADNGSMVFGSGHLNYTPLPGEIGNCVIAGHRDSFFRNLGKLNIGDSIYLEGMNYSEWYKIKEIKICDKNDVSMIQSLQSKVLTLVTCYPFNFLGAAPKRYIIQAFPINSKLNSS